MSSTRIYSSPNNDVGIGTSVINKYAQLSKGGVIPLIIYLFTEIVYVECRKMFHFWPLSFYFKHERKSIFNNRTYSM